MIERCKAQRIEILHHEKVDSVNFKIYMQQKESEFVKKSVCYYIDLTNNKAFVT